MIPIVAALASSGLNLLASAVQAKGKEFIEEKLGVKLETEVQTPEGLLRLRELEFQNEDSLRDFVIRQQELELENTKSAREANVQIQNSANASWLAKNAAYVIDFAIILAALAMLLLVMFKAVPEANKELFYTAFGALWVQVGTILNFHRGSSQGSKDKQRWSKEPQ